MLSAKQLEVKRGSKTILHDINLSLVSGQITGVLGSNGAGKSTLLAALCGELTPTQGEVMFAASPLADWDNQQRAQHLAVLPQTSTLNFGFTVQQVVAMGRLPYTTGQAVDQQIIEQVLHQVDATNLAERNYLQLSGGERQRVHLARVLAQLMPASGRQVLLLDEPTSMLDPLHQHSTLQAVRAFAEQGGAVLVILHDLNLAARYCDQLLLLDQGQIVIQGSPAEVLTAQRVEQVFGLEVLVQPHPERGHPVVISR